MPQVSADTLIQDCLPTCNCAQQLDPYLVSSLSPIRLKEFLKPMSQPETPIPGNGHMELPHRLLSQKGEKVTEFFCLPPPLLNELHRLHSCLPRKKLPLPFELYGKKRK
jgi:hypothetical protein